MQSPVAAILWENWRLTRVEAAWRLALGIVASVAVPLLFGVVAANFLEEREAVRDFAAVIALFLVIVPNLVNWPSTAQAQWLEAGVSVSSPLHPAGSNGRTRRRPDGVPHRGSGGDLRHLGTSPEGDIRLSIPAAAGRRVDRRAQRRPGGDTLVRPHEGRPDARRDGSVSSLDRSGRKSLHGGDRLARRLEFVADAL